MSASYPLNSVLNRACYAFVCATPFLVGALVGPRALRIDGVYQIVGIIAFVALLAAIWVVAAPWRASDLNVDTRRLTIAGIFFLSPFVLMSLLWVGIGTPFEATATENRMRYVVLLASSVVVTVAFVLLKEELEEAGERTYSTLAFAFAVLAGAGYFVWTSFQLGMFVLFLRHGTLPSGVAAVSDVLDVLLFADGALSYIAVACLARALERVGWLGRRAAAIYVTLNMLALAFLIVRGLSFPDPSASADPWYFQPGFIAGIPAIPWFMPALLGAVLVGRVGVRKRMPAHAT